jgi:hypothetical protein
LDKAIDVAIEAPSYLLPERVKIKGLVETFFEAAKSRDEEWLSSLVIPPDRNKVKKKSETYWWAYQGSDAKVSVFDVNFLGKRRAWVKLRITSKDGKVEEKNLYVVKIKNRWYVASWNPENKNHPWWKEHQELWPPEKSF